MGGRQGPALHGLASFRTAMLLRVPHTGESPSPSPWACWQDKARAWPLFHLCSYITQCSATSSSADPPPMPGEVGQGVISGLRKEE